MVYSLSLLPSHLHSVVSLWLFLSYLLGGRVVFSVIFLSLSTADASIVGGGLCCVNPHHR